MSIRVQEVVQILEGVRALEDGGGLVDETCADMYPETADFWKKLSAAERNHARIAVEMAKMVAADPGDYEMGRPLSLVAITHVIKGMAEQRDVLLRKKTPLKQALAIALDLEQSILERSYADFLKSKSPLYNSLVQRLVVDTTEHRRLLAEKMASLG